MTLNIYNVLKSQLIEEFKEHAIKFYSISIISSPKFSFSETIQEEQF